MKVSAVAEAHRFIQAPVRVFHSQDAVKDAFKAGEFTSDTIVVVRFQGPKFNGMPELHGLTPVLSILQGRGLKVALVTDGRMSGASGKVPAAIHVSPEAADGGMIAKLQDGDVLRIDAMSGELDIVTEGVENRQPATETHPSSNFGMGRELFSALRAAVGPADQGASVIGGTP
jgi:phosphogluconate dehydratase